MRSGNAETEWVDALVDLLEQEGHPKPARSGVVRLALLWLQEAVAGRRRAEIFKFCVNRERGRLLGLLGGTGERSSVRPRCQPASRARGPGVTRRVLQASSFINREPHEVVGRERAFLRVIRKQLHSLTILKRRQHLRHLIEHTRRERTRP